MQSQAILSPGPLYPYQLVASHHDAPPLLFRAWQLGAPTTDAEAPEAQTNRHKVP